MTTSASASSEPLQPPYPVDSPEGQETLRGLFRQAWRALPADVLERCCAAILADDDDGDSAAGPSPRR